MQIYMQKSRAMLLVIFIIMMTDYMLTFLGINYFKCIVEANPLMISSFNSSLFSGMLHRAIQSIIPVSVLYYAIAKEFKIIYYRLIQITLAVECMVLILHMNWLIKYFMFLY